MGKFRKTNKGKYDFKQMGREAGKAWRKVKGGGVECDNDFESYKCKKEIDDEIAAAARANSQGHKNVVLSAKARALTGEIHGGRNRRTQKRRR